jgi:hypothetical protein
MRQTRLLTFLLVLAAAAGCSKHATDPVSGGGPPSPVLVATQPTARSAMVLYDAEIWGQFDRALDPATVNTQTTFLKIDGQRIPCTVTYDDALRRVTLQPKTTLQLQRTYTVEFSTAIHSADGVPLPPNVFFQFTTNSLRRMKYDFPARDSTVGPLSMLGWGGAQGPLNEVTFEVYASEDSLAVEQRTAPRVQRSVFTRLLPSVAWPLGHKLYWAVTAEHAVTHERLAGPVTSFQVVPASVPVDSVVIRLRDYGSNSVASRATQYCTSTGVPSGPTYNASLHWDLAGFPSTALIVGATISIAAQDNYANRYAFQVPTLWMAQTEWSSCAVNAPGPPYPEVDGLLSSSVPMDGTRVEFTSDRLGAFFEAARRGDIYTHGTLLRTNENVFYHSSSATIDPSRLPYAVIRYVQPGTTAAR